MTLKKAAILLALILPLHGCEVPPEPVRVGLLVWPPYELAHLARDRGYFEADAVELVTFHTPAEMVRSYRFGIIDAMFVTSQFALTNATGMADSRIIYVIDFSYGGDTLLAQASIDSPEELRGKRVGMEAGPLGAYTLVRALHETPISRQDVEIVFIDTPDQLEAFRSGLVDAVATYEPTRSKLLNEGANELFNSESIPLEIIDVLIARKPVIEDHAKQLTALLRGVDRALADYRAEPARHAELMAARQGLTVADFQRAMNGVRLLNLEENLALLSGEDERLLRGLKRQCDVMHKAGMLESIPPVEPLINSEIVKRAVQ